LSLLRQVACLEEEKERLEKLIGRLSEEARYREPVQALRARPGVGLLVAMVYLTEMGELGRFSNRRQVASYVGLAPSSHDSGETERKGHITRQGSGRVRKALCQAVWAALRTSAQTKKTYGRLVGGQAKRRKIAVVALMRQLAIKLWHAGLEAQRAAPAAAAA
jgi:transposase